MKYCFLDIEVSKALSFALFTIIEEDKIDNIKTIEDIKPYTRVIPFYQHDKIEAVLKQCKDEQIPVVGFNILDFDIPLLLYNVLTKSDNKGIVSIVDNSINNTEGENTSTKQTVVNVLRHFNMIREFNKWFNNLVFIDLYKLNDWDNDARRASLKWVATNMQSDNIVENPISFNKETLTEEEKKLFVRYCANDILETIRVYKYSKKFIEMRKEVYGSYKKHLKYNTFLSSSNTEMGAKIIQAEFKEQYGIDLYKEKDNYHKVKYIFDVWNELLFDNVREYISNNKDFHDMLIAMFSKSLHRNEEYSFTFNIHNTINNSITPVVFGKGGGHGLLSEGLIMKNDDKELLIDFDVAGYYPEIVMQNKIYPINTGEKFIDVYKFLKSKRKEYKKGTPLNKAYKESMNAVIGLSNSSPGSAFFDPSFFFKITINGQLSILILIDMIKKQIPMELIMFNTDGCTLRIYKEDKERFMQICKEWESIYKYELEFTDYDRIYFEHINSYIAVHKEPTDLPDSQISKYEFIKDGYKYKIKCKGNLIPYVEDLEPHKNTGMRIVYLATYNYVVHNIPIQKTILNNKDIKLYCDMVRINKNTSLVYKSISNPNEIKQYEGKVLRFIYCNNKVDDDRIVIFYRRGKNGDTLLNKTHPNMLICNNINDVKYEDLDIDYYMSVARNIVKDITNIKTLNLFNV